MRCTTHALCDTLDLDCDRVPIRPHLESLVQVKTPQAVSRVLSSLSHPEKIDLNLTLRRSIVGLILTPAVLKFAIVTPP
jgi:hypothetical protein